MKDSRIPRLQFELWERQILPHYSGLLRSKDVTMFPQELGGAASHIAPRALSSNPYPVLA